MSPNSVSTYQKHLQVLLDKLGPPGQRNRDASDVLVRVPWAKPPKEVERIPRTITPQQLSDCIMASVAMEVPKVPASSRRPGGGRCCWSLEHRVADRHAAFDADGRNRLAAKPACACGSPDEKPAADDRSLEPGGDRRVAIHPNGSGIGVSLAIARSASFLAIPSETRGCCRDPKSEWFGMHVIRKTVATMLYEVSPGAASRPRPRDQRRDQEELR